MTEIKQTPPSFQPSKMLYNLCIAQSFIQLLLLSLNCQNIMISSYMGRMKNWVL